MGAFAQPETELNSLPLLSFGSVLPLHNRALERFSSRLNGTRTKERSERGERESVLARRFAGEVLSALQSMARGNFPSAKHIPQILLLVFPRRRSLAHDPERDFLAATSGGFPHASLTE